MKYAILLLVLCACRSAAVSTAPNSGFEILVQGYQSGEHSPGYQLITNAEDWHTFWKRHSAWRIPPAPEPAVDFAEKSVIVVRAGDQPSAGWVLATNSVWREADVLHVDAVLDVPPSDAVVPQVVTQPYQILLVPRTSGPLLVKVDQRRINR
ncbi:MAG: protease complex subunit PrcB family protein [Planctomycetes bacterium]|nr:protease complex subunit PrcB family protein [Planctomycetota bacterium]